MTPAPNLSPLAAMLLSVAHAIAPNKDKLWLEDMQLEAAFVPNKLRFAFSALKLALSFRWKTLKHNRPAALAFTSVALAALATLLFVPRLFVNQPTTNVAMTAPDTYETTSEYLEDAAAERGITAEAQAGGPAAEAPTQDAVAEAGPEVQEPIATVSPPAAITPAPQLEPRAEAAEPTDTSGEEASGDINQESLALEPAIPDEATVPIETTVPIEATAPSASSEPTPDAAAQADEAMSNSVATIAEAANPSNEENEAQAKQRNIPAPPTPSADTVVLSTQVRNPTVTLEAKESALLTIYSGSDFAGNPRIHRYLEPGEVLTLTIPFSLYTNNAAALSVTVDGSSFSLAETNTEQFRVFNRP
jgi:hypothetical protein